MDLEFPGLMIAQSMPKVTMTPDKEIPAMTQGTLSLCMIVKDEEEMLPGLLDSVAGLWDEFIVADTGSTDNTVALLTEAGARVISHVWQNDFSAARNASIAEATSDWILFLDADERLTKTLSAQIRELIKSPEAGAATVVLRNDLPGGLNQESVLLRLFRNHPTLAFEHRIHEDISATVQTCLAQSGRHMVALSGIVQHLGYVREVASARDKKTRDLTLLEQSVAGNSQDFYSWFKILEQARFWKDRPLWQKTAVRALIPWEKDEINLGHEAWSGELASLLAQGLFDDPEKQLAWLDGQRSKILPNGPYIYQRGLLLESLGRLPEATDAFNECIGFASADKAAHNNVRPLLALCRLAAAGGNMASATKYANQAAQAAPRDPEALLALVMFVGLEPGTTHLANVVSQHVQNFQDAAIPLAHALLTCGQLALAKEVLTNVLPQNEEAALGLLTLALMEGRPWDMEINLTQEAADRAFQSWVTTLWRSRQYTLMEGFLDHYEAVTEVFPWLPEWLKSATAQSKEKEGFSPS